TDFATPSKLQASSLRMEGTRMPAALKLRVEIATLRPSLVSRRTAQGSGSPVVLLLTSKVRETFSPLRMVTPFLLLKSRVVIVFISSVSGVWRSSARSGAAHRCRDNWQPSNHALRRNSRRGVSSQSYTRTYTTIADEFNCNARLYAGRHNVARMTVKAPLAQKHAFRM